VAAPVSSSVPPEAGVPVTSRRSGLARLRRGAAWPWRIAGYVFFLGFWQLFSTYVVEGFVLPAPTVVVQRMWEIAADGSLWENAAVTYGTILRAFAVALVIGTTIGIAMGLSRWWDGFFRDGLLTVFATPGLVVVLVCLIVFGISWIGPLTAIVVMATPYIALNVSEGVEAIDKDVLDMTRSFRMSRWTRARHVIIPAVAPYLFQGMRFAFALSWKIAMLTEVFGGTDGIGYNIRIASNLFKMDDLLAWVFWFVVSALILERLVLQRLVNRSLRWRPEIQR
jgi:NitT/TauT family transport system permease protein